MQHSIKLVPTNLIAKDWKILSKYYCDVFGCKPTYPERDLSGEWLDKITEINSYQNVMLKVGGYTDVMLTRDFSGL